MSTKFTPLSLNPETELALNDIRTSEQPGRLFGRTQAEAEAEVRKVGMPMLEDAGLQKVVIMQYSWYLRELARVFRTRTGNDLAWHIETVMRKWLGYGLEPNTMQLLACEIHQRMKAAAVSAETGEETAKTPRTPRSRKTKPE